MSRVYLTKIEFDDEHTETIALVDVPQETTNQTEAKVSPVILRGQKPRNLGFFRIPEDPVFVTSVKQAEDQTGMFNTFNIVDQAWGPDARVAIAAQYTEMRACTGLTDDEINALYVLKVEVQNVYRHKDGNYRAALVLKWDARHGNL